MQGVAKDPAKDKRHQHPRIDRNIDPLPGEIWKDVTEWKGHELREGYQVSSLGRIRNLGRIVVQRDPAGRLVEHSYPACMMRPSTDPDGYLVTSLCIVDSTKKRSIDCRVHQLVATYFLDAKPRPDQTHVNHIDGDKTNNTSKNLEWASPAENNKHARDAGLARLGASQAIQGRIIEWGLVCSSKTQTDKALGRYSGYIDRCKQRSLPIIDKHSGQEVHVEWIDNRKELA